MTAHIGEHLSPAVKAAIHDAVAALHVPGEDTVIAHAQPIPNGQPDAWRQVAIALMGELAERGVDPLAPSTLAYNHARNGRHTEALAALQPAHKNGGAG